jgi:hypothetical protein
MTERLTGLDREKDVICLKEGLVSGCLTSHVYKVGLLTLYVEYEESF